MRHGVKILVNELWSNTTINFGCISFWTNPSNLLGKILKFMLEIRQGSEVLQIIKFAQQAKEA